MNSRILLLCPLFALAPGCVAKRALHADAQASAAVVHEAHAVTLRSEKKHSVALTLSKSSFKNRTNALPTLLLAVTNHGQSPMLLDVGHIHAFSGGRPVQVYDANGLEARRHTEREQLAASRAEAGKNPARSLAVRSPGDDFALPNPAYDSGTGDASSSGGFKHGARLGDQFTLPEANVSPTWMDAMLTDRAISAGDTDGGVIKLRAEDIASSAPLTIIVSVGGESHEFRFMVGT